jgi:pilus assembly protein Flp/PilA
MIKRIFASDETGAASVEYGLLAALIAATIIVAVGVLGTNVFDLFDIDWWTP